MPTQEPDVRNKNFDEVALGYTPEQAMDEAERLTNTFMECLNVDRDFAEALVEAGFTTIEEIAFVDPQEIINSIDGIDEEMANTLQEYAKDARLNVFTPSGKKVSEEIINLEGMDTVFARALAQMEVVTLEDLAECATDDLSDIPGFEAEKVGKIILAARNLTWFKDEQ